MSTSNAAWDWDTGQDPRYREAETMKDLAVEELASTVVTECQDDILSFCESLAQSLVGQTNYQAAQDERYNWFNERICALIEERSKLEVCNVQQV